MASDLHAGSSPSALRSISETLAEFRSACAAWELEIENLCDQLESLGRSNTAADEMRTEGETLRGQFENLDRTLREQGRELCEQQNKMSHDLVSLHSLVERQTELLAAVLAAAIRSPQSKTREAKADPRAVPGDSSDPLARKVLAQFETLRAAAEMASTSS